MEDGLSQCTATAGIFTFGLPPAMTLPTPEVRTNEPSIATTVPVLQPDDADDDAWAGLPPVNLTLNGEQWEKLHAMLNRPPREIPRLRKLLTEPGVCG